MTDTSKEAVPVAWNGPGETPHKYSPDYMAMGDCRICGHTYEAHQPSSPKAATQTAQEAVIMRGLSDDANGLGRFRHHPDPAIDFCVEVETLESRLHQAENGLCKPADTPETVAEVLADIKRAMEFIVGGDEGAVRAKGILRGLEKRATPTACKTCSGFGFREHVLQPCQACCRPRVSVAEALKLAASRLQRLALEIPSTTSLRAEAFEWADEANRALKGGE